MSNTPVEVCITQACPPQIKRLMQPLALTVIQAFTLALELLVALRHTLAICARNFSPGALARLLRRPALALESLLFLGGPSALLGPYAIGLSALLDVAPFRASPRLFGRAPAFQLLLMRAL